MHSNALSSLLLLGLAQMAPTASALPSAHNCPSSSGGHKAPGKALYTLDNNRNNSVVALKIGQDGLLSQGTSTATGGAGADALTGPNMPSGPDSLFSQSALTVAGKYLFAVNPGSNTVTMFEIDGQDPTQLSMVGQPAAVPGDFPNTVAASIKNKLVCVATTGTASGVSCASFSGSGMGEMDQLRAIDLQQSNPPVGPVSTVSQVFFSNDQNTVYTAVKNNGGNTTDGYIVGYPVESSRGTKSVSQKGVTSFLDGIKILFGSATIPHSTDLFVTDAAFGGAVVSVGQNGTATTKAKATIPGQQATCWVAISPRTNTAFVTDGNIDQVTEMSLEDASVLSIINLGVGATRGLLDIGAAGDFLYVLSPGDGTTAPIVSVLEAESKRFVQTFNLTSLGVTQYSQGVAVLL